MNQYAQFFDALLKLAGFAALVLGIGFWTGTGLQLIPLHALFGLVVVISLWTLAGMGARARLGAGRVALCVGWGILVLAVGIGQMRLLPGPSHWIVQVLHLALGAAAVSLGVGFAKRLKGGKRVA